MSVSNQLPRSRSAAKTSRNTKNALDVWQEKSKLVLCKDRGKPSLSLDFCLWIDCRSHCRSTDKHHQNWWTGPSKSHPGNQPAVGQIQETSTLKLENPTFFVAVPFGLPLVDWLGLRATTHTDPWSSAPNTPWSVQEKPHGPVLTLDLGRRPPARLGFDRSRLGDDRKTRSREGRRGEASIRAVHSDSVIL